MKRNSKKNIIFLIIFIIVILIIIFRFIQPITLEYAKNIVQQTASYAIHDVITDKIYKNRSQYENLIILERDNSNKITALKTDTILADFLKIQISRETYDALNKLEQSGVEIPIGSILFPTLFAGKGPKINIGISSLGYADADFISAFTQAGINQTRHQIILEVNAEANVLTFLGFSNIKIKNQFIITDTVIVGNVPNSYTYIDDTEQTLLGKINDYAE